MMCARCNKRRAVIFVSRPGQEKQEGYCIKCASELNIGPVQQIMKQFGISEDDYEDISDTMEDVMDNLGDGFVPGGVSNMPLFGGIIAPKDSSGEDVADKKARNKSKNEESPEAGSKKKHRKRNQRVTDRNALNMYCADLTAKAKAGKIDAIIGREEEIYRMTQILCRRTKNNPCLIGEPGVGKTAVAEGLALRIASKDVPAKLQDKEIFMLDMTALVAGTQFRGQFESRIKKLIDEIKKEGNIILFIDEVHQLVGAGDAEGGMNAANILKPALSRGEIQVIGATTFNEYRKNIEKDAALERRFQPIKVEEPSIAQTYEILKGIKSYYENFHKVEISDELLYKTVTWSERYINDRFLPDKAIDLLDEACTSANLRNKAISDYELSLLDIEDLKADEEEISTSKEPDFERLAQIRTELLNLETLSNELKEKASDNAVLEEDIARVIELWTGIPAKKVIDSDIQRLKDLEKHLKARIIGQDEAVEAVSAAIKRTRIQLSIVKRPASFIFVGSTGVGKTELVKQLANELFDTPETLIRLDMSEFMEKHSVSRIIGSPPGYVGYDEAGQLTEKVRRKPYSVVLFDEIEKAHPDVLNILLQILDEGKISDAQGRTVNFANTVIIMTSNAGSNIKEGAIGFAKDKKDSNREKKIKALSSFLRPEFLGRVDEIVVFNDLSKEDYVKIAKILIDEYRPALDEKGIKLDVSDDVYEYIAEKSVDGVRGARDVRNCIRKEIEDKIADIIIESSLPVTSLKCSMNNGELEVISVKE
ncbi:MAG TPA: ATP-dependent Clp protease ATP-binding subunit [Clostridiales bacterium]|nr:ATP-dependent Clp protease ATP-binding subunit [Clostridiales bacterium]